MGKIIKKVVKALTGGGDKKKAPPPPKPEPIKPMADPLDPNVLIDKKRKLAGAVGLSTGQRNAIRPGGVLTDSGDL